VSPRPVVYDTPRRLVAEALGTAFLLVTVIGSGIMAERLADGNLALALLCNTIPTGAILAVLILMLGPVSGAHFNPAVTLSFLLQRELSAGDAIAYVAAQAVGGVAGTWCAHAMFEEPLLMLSLTPRTGAGQWLGETIATFGLVATIIACVRLRPAVVAPAVGLCGPGRVSWVRIPPPPHLSKRCLCSMAYVMAALIFFPPLRCGLPCGRSPLLGRHLLGTRPAPLPPQLNGSLVLTTARPVLFLDLASRDLGYHHRRANHVGRALLPLRSFRHG
jgi:hypothetical protein